MRLLQLTSLIHTSGNLNCHFVLCDKTDDSELSHESSLERTATTVPLKTAKVEIFRQSEIKKYMMQSELIS